MDQLIKYMIDVAMGMHYIMERGLVHRVSCIILPGIPLIIQLQNNTNSIIRAVYACYRYLSLGDPVYRSFLV